MLQTEMNEAFLNEEKELKKIWLHILKIQQRNKQKVE